MDRVSEPDFSILIVAANRCLADRLGAAVATAGGEAMRPSFGFVIRAVAAEQPTVSRLAELLGVTKQAASRLADDMVRLGYLERAADEADRRRVSLRLSPVGERIMARAREESAAMEAELADRFGASAVASLRELLTDFVVQHGGGAELAANRARATERA
jgi:DNA-binding MarR family transcriptional regulator